MFAVKAKFDFPFGKQVLRNKYNFYSILAGAALGMFIIYTPPLHVVFGGTDKLSPLYWLISVGFGILLLAWASFRVVLMRKGLEQTRVKDIKGLMMCESMLHDFANHSMLIFCQVPTMRTMSMREKV